MVKAKVQLAGTQVGLLSRVCGSKVRLFGQQAAANCAALPSASAGQCATSNYKPLLFRLPCKWWHINVGTFNLYSCQFHLFSFSTAFLYVARSGCMHSCVNK